MAEYCLDCFNKYNKLNYSEKEVILKNDFCEGCNEIKPCVIKLHRNSLTSVLKKIMRKKAK